MQISQAVDIRCTPDKVFYWLGDPQRAMTWMASVSTCEILYESPEMVGTTFRETVEEDGQGTELQGVVTAWKPNELIAFHLSGKYNTVDVEYRLQDIESGTRLTQNANVCFKSLMKLVVLFMGRAFKHQVMEQSKKEFINLKALCEKNSFDQVYSSLVYSNDQQER